MPHTQNLPPDLMALPDWAVLSDKQTTELLGVSRDTLGRLDRSGRDLLRVRLSPRRHGRLVGELRSGFNTARASPSGTTP